MKLFKQSLEGVPHKNQMVFRLPLLLGKEQKSREERLELGRTLTLFHCQLVIAEFCSGNNTLQVNVGNNPRGKLHSVISLKRLSVTNNGSNVHITKKRP